MVVVCTDGGGGLGGLWWLAWRMVMVILADGDGHLGGWRWSCWVLYKIMNEVGNKNEFTC